MQFSLTESKTPRYIYINPETNRVHLLVPVVGGQEISTDNTCQSTKSLKEFFNGTALRELNTYQSALEFDLQWLDKGNLRTEKKQRLNQIKEYIKAISTIKKNYTEAIQTLMQVPSNLYSIQLRPRAQDPHSRVINPVFSINRQNDATSTPLSALYNTMFEAYPDATIADISPRGQLNQAVLAALPEQAIHFTDIQHALTEECKRLFGLSIDFTKDSKGQPIVKTTIDDIMGFTDDPGTTQDYIDVLLNSCAEELWDTIPTASPSPFYSQRFNPEKLDKFDKLSILTQFFLAHINFHCKAQGISDQNFGQVLDASLNLSRELVSIVFSALGTGASVEDSLCTFFNNHQQEFGLNKLLSETDRDWIKQKFNRTYATVTASQENPHMDDFMILDTSTQTGLFVTHQGSICTDFSELLPKNLDNKYFQVLREDFEKPRAREIPGVNEHIQGNIDLDIKTILSRVTDDSQFEKLSKDIKEACMQSPTFKSHLFLHDVAKGKQNKAGERLLNDKENAQELLTSSGLFTDYSGRIFNCTAYEYAYWAKDTHMRRMLEHNMDETTKANLLTRVEYIEEHGLQYHQNSNKYCTKHFDFGPLKTALNNYVQGYENWESTSNVDAIKAAWMVVGLAQRDLPVHVIDEYCRPDRSFDPTPQFNEDTLPRVVTFFNFRTVEEEVLFPLVVSDSSGLGVDFALLRCGGWKQAAGVSGQMAGSNVQFASMVISYLDEVRTHELAQSREILKSIEPGSSFSM